MMDGSCVLSQKQTEFLHTISMNISTLRVVATSCNIRFNILQCVLHRSQNQ